MALPVPPCAEAQSLYGHSPVHIAVFNRDHVHLRRILLSLSRPPPAGSIKTEAESVAAEKRALETGAVIDRRDVPGKETPLCLAVRLKDPVAVEMLMLAGADVSLQNFGGWTPLQEAVCARDEGLTAIILRHYQVIAWAKYMRRLPALAAVMHRMRDFYMELTWQFESAVVPFIARIAPSDTYRIWKAGSCLRADMTLAGFDGLRIKRKAQSLLFYGKGTLDGRVKAGTLLMLNHEKKETFDALEGAGGEPSDAELAQDVRAFFQTNVYRAGVDVSSAKVVPITSWRGNVRSETISSYKTKVHEVQNVHLRFKSRRVPGALTDEELFGTKGKKGGEGKEKGGKGDGGEAQRKSEEEEPGLVLDEESRQHLDSMLTEEERRQLDAAMLMRDEDVEEDGEGARPGASRSSEEDEQLKDKMQNLSTDGSASESSSAGKQRNRWSRWRRSSGSSDTGGGGSEKESLLDKDRQDKKGRKGGKKGAKEDGAEGKEGRGEASTRERNPGMDADEGRRSPENGEWAKDGEEGKETDGVEKKEDNEMRRGVKPQLWLTEEFPLEMAELMPLLDLMANKVKAVQRVKELLMTKLPNGTVPVKIAIPIIPTIRVSVTFSKFEEYHGARPRTADDKEAKTAGGGEEEDDEFHTPTGSPEREGEVAKKGSWFLLGRGKKAGSYDDLHGEGGAASLEEQARWLEDPFEIPKDYEWIDLKERKRREREKRKKAKAKAKAKTAPTGALPPASGAAKEKDEEGGTKGGGGSTSISQAKEGGTR
eukprot:TRINITY_DN2052_c0_g1_i1.p1 TRINITY_DN2052_c0_g1~~TRINITY_DN2052_c0_g1_i1.p1  ORF type:complete len:766 (+),score=199.88 TRINITY_DN2052_c0_g1_i1:261-2558(+)